MEEPKIYIQITRKSLPTRLTDAGIAFATVHDPSQGGRLLYVIDGERLTHGEVERKYPQV